MKFPRKFLRALIVGMMVILIIGTLGAYNSYQSSKNSLKDELKRSADTLLVVIEPPKLERLLAQPEDLNSIDYLNLRDQFKKFENLYKKLGIRGFYVMKIIGSKILFSIDSAEVDDPWHSEPGVVYQEPPLVLTQVFNDGQGRFAGPYTDEYGSFFSYFDSIKNSEGNIVGVIGLDIDASFFNSSLNDSLIVPIILAISLTLLYFLILLFYLRQSENLFFAKEEARLKSQYQTVVEQSLMGIGIVKNGVFNYVNTSLLKMFGFDKKEELVGRTLYDVIYEEDFDFIKKSVTEKGEAIGLQEQYILRGVKKDGAVIFVKILTIVTSIGEDFGSVLLCFFLDITKEQEAEKERKAHSDELEKMNNFMVGRELKMVELKKEIEVLKTRLGEK